MSVKATITLKDETVLHREFHDFYQLAFWMKEHHGEYKGFEAHVVKASEIRQGRENNG